MSKITTNSYLEGSERTAFREAVDKGHRPSKGETRQVLHNAEKKLFCEECSIREHAKEAHTNWRSQGRELVQAAGNEGVECWGEGEPDRLSPTDDEYHVVLESANALTNEAWKMSLYGLGIAALVILGLAILIFDIGFANAFWRVLQDDLSVFNNSEPTWGIRTLVLGILILSTFFHWWARTNSDSSLYKFFRNITIGLAILYCLGMGSQFALENYERQLESDNPVVILDPDMASTLDASQESGVDPLLFVLTFASKLSFLGMIAYLSGAFLVFHYVAATIELSITRILDAYNKWQLVQRSWPIFESNVQVCRDADRHLKEVRELRKTLVEDTTCALDGDVQQAITKLQNALDDEKSIPTSTDPKGHKVAPLKRPDPGPDASKIAKLERGISNLKNFSYDEINALLTDSPSTEKNEEAA